MEKIETYRGDVYPWHCDFNDHMHLQYYAGKFEEANWHFLACIGITASYLKKEKRAMVAAEQNIKLLEELHAGNVVFVKTGLVEYKSKAIVLFHNMINAETNRLVAEAKMIGVHIDKKSRSEVPFPEEICQKINELVILNRLSQR